MMNSSLIVGLCISFVSIIFLLFLLHIILKSPHPIFSAIKSSVSGIILMFIVNLTFEFTGVSIPVSPLNIGISSIGGGPGVCMLLIANFIFSH